MDNVQSSADPQVVARAVSKVKRHVLPLFVVMFIAVSYTHLTLPTTPYV